MSNEAPLKIVSSSPGQHPLSILQTSGFNVWIDDNHILNDINLKIPKNQITCIIGPSGSGKSTLIRSFNRMNDDISGFQTEGNMSFKNRSIYTKEIDTAQLRSSIGMVFQKPCVFPKSIKENVLFGVQHQRTLSKHEKLHIVEKHLKSASLWKEVSNRLNDQASTLSIGQQQRLSIARTLAVEPEIILLDEPTSSLDPVSSRAIEHMMESLKQDYTIVFVTHNIRQAQRIADHLVFICNGEIIEQGDAAGMFDAPSNPKTKAYLTDDYCDC